MTTPIERATAANEAEMQALQRKAPRPPHGHSDWQVRDAGDGVLYCAACGDRVRPDIDRWGGEMWTTVDPIDEVWGRLEEAGMLDGPRRTFTLEGVLARELRPGDVMLPRLTTVTHVDLFPNEARTLGNRLMAAILDDGSGAWPTFLDPDQEVKRLVATR